MACTTAWIASPAETVALLDEIERFTVDFEGANGTRPAKILNPAASEFSSRADQSTSADAAAHSLLNGNGFDGTDHDSAVASPVTAEATIKRGLNSLDTSTTASVSSNEISETASVRIDNTATPHDVMQPRPNGLVSTTSPAQKQGNIPTTDQERREWIDKAKGAIGKFAGRYGTPKTGGSDTASVRSGRSGRSGTESQQGAGSALGDTKGQNGDGSAFDNAEGQKAEPEAVEEVSEW